MKTLKDVVIANKSYACLSIEDYSEIDTIAMNVIRQDCPEFLLPMRTMNVDGMLEIRYDMSDGVRLKYANHRMTRQELIALLRSMLKAFLTCSDWFLDYHYFCLEEEQILVRQNGLICRFAYLPAASAYHSDAEVKDFFENLLFAVDILDERNLPMDLLKVMKNGSGIYSLSEYLEKSEQTQASSVLMSAPVSTPAPVTAPAPATVPQPAPMSQTDSVSTETYKAPEKKSSANLFSGFGFGGKAEDVSVKEENIFEKKDLAGKKFGANDIESQLMQGLFGEEAEEKPVKSGGFFGKKEKIEKQKPEKSGGLFGFGKKDKAETTTEPASTGVSFFHSKPEKNRTEQPGQSIIPIKYTGDDVTDASDEEFSEQKDYNHVILTVTETANYQVPGQLDLDLMRTGGSFVVGRRGADGAPNADYNFDASIKFISRRQLMIERAGNGWNIMDLSGHGTTLLNGSPLPPNARFPLNVGDQISILRKQSNARITYRVN